MSSRRSISTDTTHTEWSRSYTLLSMVLPRSKAFIWRPLVTCASPSGRSKGVHGGRSAFYSKPLEPDFFPFCATTATTALHPPRAPKAHLRDREGDRLLVGRDRCCTLLSWWTYQQHVIENHSLAGTTAKLYLYLRFFASPCLSTSDTKRFMFRF